MARSDRGLQPAANGADEVRVIDGSSAAGAPTPIITLDSLQRYIDTERSRNRHALLWTSTLFLFIVLLVLVMFVSIGIHVLRRTRQTSALVQTVRVAAELHAAKLEGIADRVEHVADLQAGVKQVVELTEAKRARQEETIKANLERFGNWVETGSAREARARLAMEARLRQMEESVTGREGELQTLAKRYAELQAALEAGGAAAAEGSERVPRAAVARETREPTLGEAAGEIAAPELESSAELAATPGAGEGEAEAASSNDWMVAELASAEDLVLDDIGALEGRGPQGEISVVTFPNGDRYEGEFRDGLFNGWGIYYTRGGDRYEGEFRNDMKDGRGTYTFRNGDRYVGEFRNGMKHGRGSLMHMNGDRYVGEFMNDMPNGKGTFLYSNGNRYSGDFGNGLKNGNGVFRFANGDAYKGEFKDDQRQGKGTYLYAGGAKYMGDFHEGRRHEKGRYVYEGGEEYIGEFKEGRKDGHGVCVYPNGVRLKGLWKNDQFVRRMD